MSYKTITKIKSSEWIKIFEVEPDVPLFIGDIWMSGFNKKYKYIPGCSLKQYLYVSTGGGFFAFMNKKEITRFQKEGRLFFRNRYELKRHIGKLKKLTEKTAAYTKYLAGLDFATKSNNGLLKLFKKFIQLHEEEAAYTKFHIPEFSVNLQRGANNYKKEIKNLIRLAAKIMYKVQRVNLGKNLKNLKNLLNEIARRAKITTLALDKLSIKEIKSLLAGKPIMKRKEYVYFYNKGHKILVINNEAKQIINKILKHEKEKKIFSGKGISHGKVVGKAFILSQGDPNFKNKLKQIKEDRVIITSMIRPQIFHFVQRAKALVTDEGGLTSHVSILAREFKKPTVVGVRDSTLYFKDGDLVEVDANKGIIKLVKRQ